MTPEEINEAIAESVGLEPMFAVEKGGFFYRPNSCGYTSSILEAGRYTEQAARRELVSGEPMSIVPLPLHNYHGSLDAIVPVIWQLPEDKREAVKEYLPCDSADIPTASQWCEAYLKSKGLWNE